MLVLFGLCTKLDDNSVPTMEKDEDEMSRVVVEAAEVPMMGSYGSKFLERRKLKVKVKQSCLLLCARLRGSSLRFPPIGGFVAKQQSLRYPGNC